MDMTASGSSWVADVFTRVGRAFRAVGREPESASVFPTVRIARAAPAVIVPPRAPGEPTPLPRQAVAPAEPRPPARTRERARRAFDASMPVRERAGLSGRNEEMGALTDAMLEQGKHAVLFGARGSGKTSLGRVFGDVADEARYLVIYQSASGDSDFADLVGPCLAELAEAGAGYAGAPAVPPVATNARQVANWLIDNLDRRAILIIDEFDRIENRETKAQLASLMKLLSDMRSKVQLMVIGIAVNVDELLESHPSLRRHVAVVPVGPIANGELERLLDQCCAEAGIAIEPNARAKLTCLALGSPYHLRLFGLHATLAAERAEADVITDRTVDQGLDFALAEWTRLGGGGTDLSELTEGGLGSDVLLTAAALAAYTGSFDESRIADELATRGIEAVTAARAARRAVELLRPIALRNEETGSWRLREDTPAQILSLLALGYRPSHLSPSGRTGLSELQSLRAGRKETLS